MDNRRTRWVILLLLVLLCEQTASAYTDPGSGALLWQILVAGFVGGLYYIRKILHWLKTVRH